MIWRAIDDLTKRIYELEGYLERLADVLVTTWPE